MRAASRKMTTCSTGWHVCTLLAIATMAGAAVPSGMDLPLLKQVASDQAQNHAISPFLLSSVMSQVWLGARGNTRDEIAEVLKLDNQDAISGYKSAQLTLSKPDPDVTAVIFNRMYIRSGFSVKRDFNSLLRQYYGVRTRAFFSNAGGADAINKAVASITNGKIPTLMTTDGMRDTYLVLVGALYFKGKWQTKFDTKEPKPFLTPSGERDVPMMGLLHEFAFASFPDFDAVSLPYRNPDYSLVILKPKERSLASANQLFNSLDTLDISAVTSQLFRKSPKMLAVVMPPFKIESSYQLKEPMQNLGIRQVFTRMANLTAISETGLLVSSVVHKVFMEVNEEGTEAAAAVSASFTIRSRPAQFIVDRPFLAVLYHKGEQLNLFSAWIANP